MNKFFNYCSLKFLVVIFVCGNILLPAPANASDVKTCEVSTEFATDHATEGFNRDLNLVPSIGTHKILAISIDFSDASVTSSPAEAISNVVNLETVTSFYQYISKGVFNPVFQIFPKNVRLPEISDHYGGKIDTDSAVGGIWESQHIVFDALSVIQNDINISDFDAVMVFVSTGNSLSGYVGQTTIEDRNFYRFTTGEVHNFTLIGKGIANYGPDYASRVVAHELGHLIGLPDLYSYDANGYWTQNLPNIYTTMGTLQGSESDSLKWNKFILRWLSESQVLCFDAILDYSKINLVSNSSANSSEIELVLIKLSASKVLAIESIPLQGFFSHSRQGGFLVYTVDTSVRTGNGPIIIIPRSTALTSAPISRNLPDWLRLTDAPLISGTYLLYNGMIIENENNLLIIMSANATHIASVVASVIAPTVKTPIKTIKCIKGKVIRTVKAVAPKCPIGYKIYTKS